MPTVTKTIGTSSRDYSTLSSWEAALNGAAGGSGNDAVGECYDDSAFSEQLIIFDNTPASITLRAATGQGHDGTAGTGVRNVSNANSETIYIHGDQTVAIVIEDFEQDSNSRENIDSSTGAIHVHGNKSVRLQRLLVHGATGSAILGVYFRLGSTNGADTEVLQNSFIYDCTQIYATSSTTGVSLGGVSGPCNVYNCAIHDIRHNGTTQDCYGITQADATGEKVQNVICTGTSSGGSGTVLDFFDSSPANATWDHNASSDTSASGTGSIDSVVAADEYVSTTGGSEDFHLQETAQCVDAGTNLGSSPTAVNIDIDGETRASDWDIGADEVPTALSFTTNAAGTAITCTLDSATYTPTSGTLGFTLSGTTATVTGWTISGTLLTINTTNYLSRHETITITHVQADSEIEDGGTPLADFSGSAVNNASSVDYIKIAAATTYTLTTDRPVSGTIRIIVEGTNQSTSILDGDGFQIIGTVTGACEFSTVTIKDCGNATDPGISLTHGVGGDTYIHDTTFDASGAMSFSLGGNGRVRIENIHYMDTCLNTVNSAAGDTVPCITVAGQNGAALQSFVKTSWLDKGPISFEATVSTSEWLIENTRITGLRGGVGTNVTPNNVTVSGCYLRSEHENAWSQVVCLAGHYSLVEESIIDQGNWVVRGFSGVMEYCAVIRGDGHSHFENMEDDCTIRRTIIGVPPDVGFTDVQNFIYALADQENVLFDHCTMVGVSACPAVVLDNQGAVSDQIEFRNTLFWNWPAVAGTNAVINEGVNNWCTEDYNAFGLQDPATDPRSGAATGANSIVETGDPTFGMTGFNDITDLFDPDELADGTITVAEALTTIRGLLTPPVDSILIGAASDGLTMGAVEGPSSGTVATLPLINGGLVNLGLLRGGLIS